MARLWRRAFLGWMLWAGGLNLSAASAYLTIQAKDLEDVTGRRAAVAQVHGVFVGVGSYANPAYGRLANAAGDAEALAEALVRRCGLVEPVVLTDTAATRANLQRELRKLALRSGPDDLFVFHFSGHGLGLARRADQELKGLLFLHGAPPLADLWRGEFGTEVIDLDMLESEWRQAGLKAKHRLVVLDSCYSGVGAYTRMIDGGLSLRNRLQRSATYILTAGGAAQTVLDGPAGGRGMLTGELIKLVESPPERARTELDGNRYLSMRELFAEIDDRVPAAAAALLNGPGRLSRSVLVETARVQVPQEARRGGEGHVFLPWRETAGAGPTPAPTIATVADAAGLPVRGVASGAGLGEWGASTRLGQTDPAYAEAMRALGRLLDAGPLDVAGRTLRVAIEPLMRPSDAALRMLLPSSSAEGALSEEKQRAAMAERRERVQGADWRRIAEEGAPTRLHEVGFTFYNFGEAPVFCYLVGIDAKGGVQLLMGRVPEDARVSSRRGTSRPQQEAGGRIWPVGWTFDDVGLEHAFLAVVTAKPWPELVEVVARLETLSETDTASRAAGLLEVLPKWLGPLEAAERGVQPTEGRLPMRDLETITLRSNQGWLGASWGWPIADGEATLGAAP